MKVAVLKETVSNENRVALVPDSVSRLVKSEIEVLVESGAGEGSHFDDKAFEAAGARILPAKEALAEADVILKIHKPAEREDLGAHEVDLMREGAVCISLLQPAGEEELLNRLAQRKVTFLSMTTVPRISRAQSMDALSSQASLAGYKAVLIAAAALGKFFPMLTTAAGTVAPAKVFILGAGVAGLQAIATARRLGAVVEAFDIRPAVKEEVQSLGAKFVEVDLGTEQEGGSGDYAKELSEEHQKAEQALVHDHVAASDVVITTAAVPGKRAPILITEETVKAMRTGSVIVDLAAESGGNCEITEPGQDVVKHGVRICGPLNVPSTVPVHASQMYAKNITTLMNSFIKEGKIELDFEDEVVKGCTLTHDGKVLFGAGEE
jgi:NAD(P) transhydrogenase subunit alpha